MFVFNLSVAVFSGSLSTHKIGSHNLLRKTTVLESQRQETLPLFPLCPENVFWHNSLFKKILACFFFNFFITLTFGSHKNCYTIRNRLPLGALSIKCLNACMHSLLNFVVSCAIKFALLYCMSKCLHSLLNFVVLY